jgi:glycosyltransferase involved in cell wall biosynthesis
MRIAQIAPLAESVPPKLYGGTERVVAWLIEELVEIGHEVTLFASGDSQTKAELVPVCPRALRLGKPRTDPTAAQTALLEAVAQRAGEFDLIHAHIDWLHLPIVHRAGVPFLTTLHGRLDLPGLSEMIGLFPTAPYVSISDNQRVPLAGARWLGTVYHGMPKSLLKPSFKQGHNLAFLGRLTHEKGADVAIRIAQATGMPLRIAAKVPRDHRSYFKDHLEPLIDGKNIQLVGEVDDRRKQGFLEDAAALLFPIDWPEPFGLVMIEAMACGTPVIAFRAGFVPEVIEDGVSGFIVDSEEEAVRAVRLVGKLNRREIRRTFERRFTAQRMAGDYLNLYRRLMSGSVSAKKPVVPVGIEPELTGMTSGQSFTAKPQVPETKQIRATVLLENEVFDQIRAEESN